MVWEKNLEERETDTTKGEGRWDLREKIFWFQ